MAKVLHIETRYIASALVMMQTGSFAELILKMRQAIVISQLKRILVTKIQVIT